MIARLSSSSFNDFNVAYYSKSIKGINTNLASLLIMTRCSCKAWGITLKAKVLKLCPFLTKILNRIMAPERQALVLHAALLFLQADKVDGYLHQVQMKTDPNRQYGSSFGTWVLYYTLQVMINYTLSGFELELYAPYEYHYVYW